MHAKLLKCFRLQQCRECHWLQKRMPSIISNLTSSIGTFLHPGDTTGKKMLVMCISSSGYLTPEILLAKENDCYMHFSYFGLPYIAGLGPLEPVIPSRAAVLAAGPGQAWDPAGEQALWEEGLAAGGGPSSADREGDVVPSTA